MAKYMLAMSKYDNSGPYTCMYSIEIGHTIIYSELYVQNIHSVHSSHYQIIFLEYKLTQQIKYRKTQQKL